MYNEETGKIGKYVDFKGVVYKNNKFLKLD